MFGINRDNLGRFAKSSFVRKTIKYGFLIALVWFSIHSFNQNYIIAHERGIYGIVARNTYNALIDDHAKANAYNSIPDHYLLNIDR